MNLPPIHMRHHISFTAWACIAALCGLATWAILSLLP